MTDAFDLALPAADEAARCSQFAAEGGVHPAGTAIRADQVLVLDVPLPWPMPVKSHPRLEGMMNVAGGGNVPTRLLAGVPRSMDDGIRLVRFRRQGGGVERSVFAVREEAAIPRVLGALANDCVPDAARLVDDVAARTLLVCTQGSHDVCCGTDGMRLFEAAARHFDDLEIIRVSHTGGHRFAPTGFTFPDGRIWAHLDLELLEGIFDRSLDPRVAARHCRGWWGAERGAAQAGEVALFRELGWRLGTVDRKVDVLDDADGMTTVRVSTDDLQWLVDVWVARRVPTISCRQPGGLPAKPGTEYAATVRV